MFSQNRHIPGCWNTIAHHAHGTKGHLQIGVALRVDRRPAKEPANPYQIEHDVLFDAIRNDRPLGEARYAAMSTLTAIMGRMAAYSGKIVTRDEAISSTLDLSPDRYTWDAKPPVLPDENGCYPVAMPGVAKVSGVSASWRQLS
jgi:hypothetical protein